MKKKLTVLTAMGILMNLLCPYTVGAEYFSTDLQRLNWLCSDFQLPVKGYVIEGWFVLFQRPGMQKILEEQLQLQPGQQHGILLDGSQLNTSLQCRERKIYVEVQLITENFRTAQHYYALWQSFADIYQKERPVGITVITQLPEQLDLFAKRQLAQELQSSLGVDTIMQELDAFGQVTGFSPQLQHFLKIGSEKINYNLSFREHQNKTAIYLAAPVIYQQY